MNVKMRILRIPATAVVTGLLILNAKVLAGSTDPEHKPNIVFILADDLGWTDVNIYDPQQRKFYETPNLDRLASQGMRFTNAYANPTCTPTRAALMSGQYYPRQPVYDVGAQPPGTDMVPAPNTDDLPSDRITIAEALKYGEYVNGFIGKWHIGNTPRHGPIEQGFDLNIGGYNLGNPGMWPGGFFEPNNNRYIDDAGPGEYLTDFLTRKAVAFIEENREHPFYLHLAYYSVHTPMQAPEERIEKYRKKKGVGGHDNPVYAAMIESLDKGVGEVMETLERLDLARNTILIFYSDNGGFGGYSSIGVQDQDTDITDNAPLRNGKNSIYEGGIRVPLIVRWPGTVSPGTVCDEPVMHIDLYPTIIDAVNISRPGGYVLDGESIVPLLRDPGTSLDREALYWHFPGYTEAGFEGGPQTVIRVGDWKLLRRYEHGKKVELYNLAEDIGETKNLADSEPDTRDHLLRMMDEWLIRMEAPMPYYLEEMRGREDEIARLKEIIKEKDALIELLQEKNR